MIHYNTRVVFNNLSTRARIDKGRGHVFIQKGDTAPSVGDELTHDGDIYEVTGVDRLDVTANARRIHIKAISVQKPKDEPLADWERELLYGSGPMPTPEIIKQVLRRSAGREVLAQLGAGTDRHLKSLLGHAIVLAKQEMALYHEREAARKVEEEDKAGKLEAGYAAHKAIAEALVPAGALPLVPEGRKRPSIADTLEAVVYYVDASAWEGRFERIVRSIRKPLSPQRSFATGGHVSPGYVPPTAMQGLHGMN